MKRSIVCGLALLITLNAAMALLVFAPMLTTVHGQGSATATPKPLPHWTYEGEEGPERWGKLDDRFAACDVGRAQSPIDVSKPQSLNLVDIKFNYQPSKLNILNNGHTIQVNYDAGSSIVFNEIEYKLVQFHFHLPSEHTVDEKHFAMELHLVHQAANGDLAVVGVLLRKGEKDNANMAAVFDNLANKQGDPLTIDKMVAASNNLPAQRVEN